jgi:succinyl-diaminopimelate desuccinylase
MIDDETLRLLSELVSINTVNDPINSIKPNRDCVQLIREKLEDVAVSCEILENDGVYSILARLGEGPPRLLFMGHYDTVPADQSEWAKPPFQFTVENGKGYGRGTLDDKANVASVISAISKLRETNFTGSLLCAFTGDEEIGGKHGASFITDTLVQRNELPTSVVNCDGMGLALITRRRNSFDISLETRNPTVPPIGTDIKTAKFITRTSSHHAAYFTPGIDSHCLLEASRFIIEHKDYAVLMIKGAFLKRNIIPSSCEITYLPSKQSVDGDSLTTLLRGLLPLSRISIPSEFSEFGVTISPNVIVCDNDRIKLELDIRAMTNDVSAVKSSIERALEILLPNVTLSIEGSGSFINTGADTAVVKAGLKTLQELNMVPCCLEGGGISDARFFAALGIPTIDFGPKGGNMHGPNEFVQVESLSLLSRFYSRLAEELCGRADSKLGL